MLRLTWYKAICELRVEAARRYMGVLWWLLEPILYMLAFYAIFAIGLRYGEDGFLPFLLCGLVPWKWFATTVTVGSTVIADNRGLMNQVYFPKVMLIGMLLLVNLIKALIVFVILVAAIAIFAGGVSVHLLAFPLVVVAQLILISGVVTVCASIVPLVPDVKLIIDNGILILFFASGIFFDITEQPPEAQQLFNLNPVARLLTCYRQVLLDQQWPDLVSLGIVAGTGLVLLAAGLWLVNHFDRRYPKVLI